MVWSVSIWPVRSISNTRSPRYTASEIECVTKTYWRSQSRAQIEQQILQTKPRPFIQRGERFVEQQDLRLGDQRARQRHAHLHAAAQFPREVRDALAQPQRVEQCLDLVSRFTGCRAGQFQRQPDVLEARSPRHEARLLKNVRQVAGEAGIDRHATLARLFDAHQQPQQGRLAAARRAEQRNALTRRHRERHSVNDVASLVRETFDEIRDVDRARARRFAR